MRGSKALFTIVSVAAVISVLAALINLPTETPYSPFNTGGNGYSELVNYSKAVIAERYTQLKGINASDSVIILPVDKGVNDSGLLNYLRNFTEAGGSLIIIDSSGYSNNLIHYLGINASVDNHPVLDEVLKLKDRFHPLIRVKGLRNLSLGNSYLVTYMPSSIRLGGTGGTYFVGMTSRYAYADLDRNGYYSPNEVMGEYVVISCWGVGNGSLTLIADYALLSDSLINYSSNHAFLNHLIGSRKAYLLTEGLNLSSIDNLKYQALRLSLGLRYQSISFKVAEFLILLGVLGVIAYSGRWVS